MDKTCTKCGQTKPVEEFRKMHGRDGQPCLPCHREANRQWREAHPDTMQAAREAWISQPENEARHKETERQRYQNDKPRILEVQKAYLADHSEERRAWKRQYDIDHQDEQRDYRRQYRLGDVEYHRARAKLWAQNNPERQRQLNREADARRRARKAGAQINDFTKEQWEWLKAAYENCCAYCGAYDEHLQQDHVAPLAKGGDHTLANIVPACKTCNARKKDRSLEVAGMEFVRHIPV